MRWIRTSLFLCMLLLSINVGVAAGVELTNSGGDLRTGWYPDEGAITPQLVAGGTFGQLWSTPVEGQVYAQPLVDDGTVLIATEHNRVYGLSAGTGAVQWSTSLLGTPFNPGEYSCGDLAPAIGATATPVIDPATNIAYLTHKGYIAGSSGSSRWYMDAIDVATGAEQPGFPVALEGHAQNAPAQSFEARAELQRPGLLLMEGVVYAAFGSDCDQPDWQGWVFGVTTAGTVRARWVADATGNGAGIWQSGAGLTSDGPGTLLLSTGNGGAPVGSIPGDTPPSNLGESIVRVRVQPDGSLKATDFFAPYDADSLDEWDADFASGGVTGLPGEYFGTASIPHLAVAVGKDGYVYLLNRDNLGGIGQGVGGADDVVQRIGPYGGVWSRPGVWPGEGGWVYIPTASGGTSAEGSSGNLRIYRYGLSGSGMPTLSLQGTSADAFGFSSGAPVITSEGTTPGTALVWIVWAANATGSGAQLRAYDPVPVNGQPVLRFSAPVGTSAKFSTPGVSGGRLFVGTRDGHVLAFGSPVTPALTGPATVFPTTTLGESSGETLTLTATEALTLSSLTSSSSQFVLEGPSRALPATLAAGETIKVPIDFSPTAVGPAAATVTASTTAGRTASFALSGTGHATTAQLEVVPPLVTFGGTEVGGHLAAAATFRNVGGSPLTIEKVNLPSAPFGASGVPAVGSQIEAGGSITINVTFDPSEGGTFDGQLSLDTSAGDEAVGLSGSAAAPGRLTVESEAVDYGQVALGASETRTFKVTNSGGTKVTITKSKPPTGGAFEATTTLSEGTTINPGQTLEESVTFEPTSVGPQSGVWQINSDGSAGVHAVSFNGTGFSPTAPGTLLVEGEAIDFGEVPVGSSMSRSFTVTNTGGTAVRITASEPPAGEFQAVVASLLPVGTIVEPGQTLLETVVFKPTSPGLQSGTWEIDGDDASGQHRVSLTGIGTGAAIPPVVELVQSPSIGPMIGTLPSEEHRAPTPTAKLLGRALGEGPKGRITLRLSCPRTVSSCRGTLALRTLAAVRVAGKRSPEVVTIAKGSFDIRGGRTATVRLTVSSVAHRVLARTRLLHGRALIISREESGATQTASTPVTVRAQPAPQS